MRLRELLLSCAALGWILCPSANAQTGSYQTVPSSAATYMKLADRQQDETDQQALAKQMDDFNQRLKALESGAAAGPDASISQAVEQNADAIGDIDAILADKVNVGHGDQKMKLMGRLHLDYWAFPKDTPGIVLLEGGDPQDRIIFRRMRLGVSGDVNDNMLYRIESEWAGGNNFSYRDAYLGFKDLPFLQKLLIGNQKRPYGLDHLNSSRFNVFMERPFAIEAFNQDARRLGIASYGVSKNLCNNWRFGIFNQELTQSGPGYIGDHYQMEVAGRLARTWWWDQASHGRGYGHMAVSGSWGDPDGLGANNQSRYATRPEARSTNRWLDTGTIAGAKSFALVGVESVTNVGPMQVVGEYMLVNVDRFDFFGSRVLLHGGYIQASYFLTGEHIPWDRTTGTIGRIKPFENFFSVCDCDGFRQRGRGAWQVAARFSYADLDDENILGGRGTSATFGMNWYWNPYARMQFNYIFGDIDRRMAGGGSYQIAGVRFAIDF